MITENSTLKKNQNNKNDCYELKQLIIITYFPLLSPIMTLIDKTAVSTTNNSKSQKLTKLFGNEQRISHEKQYL